MSLEGLSSLIQLESTRLEGAKQSNASSSQVNSSVQQTGLQTASSKQSITIQKINAEYEKDCASATVRRLESKLARERAAESLALNIAGLVTAGSLISNVWDAGKDLFAGGQKLGDMPECLQVKPITGDVQTSVLHQPGSAAKTVYFSGTNENNTETVKSYNQSGNGGVGGFRSATITNQDKALIGGAAYEQMKAAHGGRDLSFAEIQAKDPDMAERIMADKSHDMARGEVGNFMGLVDKATITEPGKVGWTYSADPTAKTETVQQIKTPTGDKGRGPIESGSIQTTNADGSDTVQLFKQPKYGKAIITNEDKAKIGGDEYKKMKADNGGKDLTYAQIKAKNPDMADKLLGAKGVDMPEAEQKDFMDKLSNPPKNTDPVKSNFISTQNADGSETIKRVEPVKDAPPNFTVAKITNEDKAKIGGDEYKKMKVDNGGKDLSYAEIKAKNPALAEKIVSSKAEVLTDEGDQNKLTGKAVISSTRGALDTTPVFTESTITNEDKAKIGGDEYKKMKAANGGKDLTIPEIREKNPALAEKIIEGTSKPITNNDDKDIVAARLGTKTNVSDSRKNIEEGLKAGGKATEHDFKGLLGRTGDNLGATGKALTNVMVQTAKDAIPYFQAYLKAKERADNTREELIEAIAKLNAANKKLKAIEMSIDVFAGGGA